MRDKTTLLLSIYDLYSALASFDVSMVGPEGQDDVMRGYVAYGRSNQFAPCASIPYA